MNVTSFLRHATTLVTGTVIAQSITIGYSLILARIYDDNDFGHFSAFVGILTILSILATASYDKALMFSRSRRRSFSLSLLVLFIATTISILVAIGSLLFVLLDIDFPLGISHFDMVVLLPLSIFVTASLQIFTYNSLKIGRTRQLACFKVAQASVTGGVQTAGGLLGEKWIVFGYLAGIFLSVPTLFRTLARLAESHRRGIKHAIIASAIRYRRYPAYVCPNELIDVASSQIPIVLIGMLFSLATLGQYGFAQRVLAAPAALLGQAVGQVFFKSISDPSISPSAMRRSMFKVWLTMGMIGLLPFSLLFVAGENIFSWIFGIEWKDAGRMAEILSILIFFRFVSSPTSAIYYKLNLQKVQVIFTIMAFFVRIAPLFLVFITSYSFFDVLKLQVLAEILVILSFNVTALLKLNNLRVDRGSQEKLKRNVT